MAINNVSDLNSTTDYNNSFSGQAIEGCFMTYIVRKPTTSYIVNSVFGILVNAILAILGTFLNALVVAIFWQTPKLRNKVTYFMIMLLSCVDICVTIIVHPTNLLNSIAEITQNPKCAYKMVYQTSAVMLSGMSYLTFFVMNVERYLSVCRPFFHMKSVTKERCFILCAVLWLIGIGTAIAPIFGADIQFFVTAMALLVLAGTFFIYLSIYRVANKGRESRLRSANRGGQEAYSVTIEETTSALESRHSTRPKKTISLFHDLQIAKMYVIVVCTTLLLNLPNALVLALFSDRVETLNGVVQSKIWTLTLVSMNSTLNSLIFFWANGRLREEGWRLCKKVFRF
ncbi:cannabinoid receptor 1-like [Dendronephthya gigantea]|uniref:cannabinoid receptor 1-like n=1 Tax=Dendronephthya gigantea TaxID=151771 RepID=UPI00106CE8BC|nr:cannabinoid receptor 1-like [Dendronephthya gigantea]